MRVLVADDEQDMARALEAMLKKAGFTVLDVFDGYSGKPAHDTSERLLFAVRKD